MKGWTKIVRLEKFDVLVQRLVNESNGEHVQITIRFSEGQYVATVEFGHDEQAEKVAIEFYKNYKKAEAQKFVDAFNLKLNGK